MRPIPILGVGIQSRSNSVTAQTRKNCYLEQSDDKSGMVAYGRPGLTLFATFGANPVRGLYQTGVNLYAVSGSTLYLIHNDGSFLNLGTLLTSSGPVFFADNGAQIMLVDGQYGYTYTFATSTFARITDADFPGAVTVTFLNGYFIINQPRSGKFWISASYDGTAWDALDFATAESSPDRLRRVMADHGQLVLFGDRSTEFWSDTGALDFPFQRIGGAVSDWGLKAICSVVKLDNTLMWLARNAQGENQVVRLSGYSMQRISTHDIETIINGYAVADDAIGMSFLHDGHSFYQLSFPNAGETWVYDASNGIWTQFTSGNDLRFRGQHGVSFLSNYIVSDYADGNLYKLDRDNYTDNDGVIVFELTGKHIFNGLERFVISELQIDMETGVGISAGQGSDPQIILNVSKDGGQTWGADKLASIGKIGEYKTRAIWRRLGMAENWAFRLRISDPVKRVILGAYIRGQ